MSIKWKYQKRLRILRLNIFYLLEWYIGWVNGSSMKLCMKQRLVEVMGRLVQTTILFKKWSINWLRWPSMPAKDENGRDVSADSNDTDGQEEDSLQHKLDIGVEVVHDSSNSQLALQPLAFRQPGPPVKVRLKRMRQWRATGEDARFFSSQKCESTFVFYLLLALYIRSSSFLAFGDLAHYG